MKKLMLVVLLALVGISFVGCKATGSACGCGGKKCADQGTVAKPAK
jgi:hypothetical protein